MDFSSRLGMKGFNNHYSMDYEVFCVWNSIKRYYLKFMKDEHRFIFAERFRDFAKI